MPNFADVHLKPEVLARYGLPDIAYPIASADLKSAVEAGGELPLTMRLHGLQVRTRDGGTEWKVYEPAMSRLAERDLSGACWAGLWATHLARRSSS